MISFYNVIIPHLFHVSFCCKSWHVRNKYGTFKKYFIYFFMEGKGAEREGKRRRKRGRETSMCGCFSHGPYWGTWPTTQACSLTGNQTGDPLVHRLVFNPLSKAIFLLHSAYGSLNSINIWSSLWKGTSRYSQFSPLIFPHTKLLEGLDAGIKRLYNFKTLPNVLCCFYMRDIGNISWIFINSHCEWHYQPHLME